MSYYVVSPGSHSQFQGESEFEPMFIWFHSTFSSTHEGYESDLSIFYAFTTPLSQASGKGMRPLSMICCFLKELSRFFTVSGSSEITREGGVAGKREHCRQSDRLQIITEDSLGISFSHSSCFGLLRSAISQGLKCKLLTVSERSLLADFH